VADNQTPQPDASESRIIASLRNLARRESAAPPAFTRRRHLKAMERAVNPPRRLPAIAVAAALVLVTATVAVRGNSGSDPQRNLAFDSQPLRTAPQLDTVPLERSEEWVILQVSADRAASVKSELSGITGADPVTVGKTSSGVTYVVPASAARSLVDTSGIVATPDTPVKATGDPVRQDQVPSWGLDRIDGAALDNSYSYISTGSGVYTYVVDTGVYAGHSDFGGRVRSGYTAVSDGNGTSDCNGHGTHVAGTIAGTKYGVAKSATVVAVRVLDCNGSGYVSSVVAGINWVVASHPGGPGVINLSLGGSANTALDAAVASATAAGLVVVVAAGNSAADACSYSPARAPSALTIGAIDSGDGRAAYSNYGSCVDLWAPGSQITSAGINGSTSSAVLSGTSMATPHVAGLAARMLQARPSSTASSIATTLSERSAASNPQGAPVVEFAEDPGFADPTTTTALETTTVPESSTTVDTVPAPTTSAPAPTTTVAATTTLPSVTTTLPVTTTSTTVPKKRKLIAPPKDFQLRFGTGDDRAVLSAWWKDDGTADSWRVGCARLSAGADAEAATTIVIDKSTVRTVDGRSTAPLAVTPEPGTRCWMVSVVGSSVSLRSNQAIVPPGPRKRRDDDSPTTTTPATSVPATTTTATPATTVAPTTTTTVAVTTTTDAPATTVAGSSRVTVPARTTVPPKTPPTTAAPKKKP
jgi:subtilisin family serine protease